MKKIIKYGVLAGILAVLGLYGCKENDWSEDYDIQYPISTIDKADPISQNIDGIVTLTGTNLDLVVSVKIGTVSCPIKSQTATSLIFTIPMNVPSDYISIQNLYQRTYTYTNKRFVPLQ